MILLKKISISETEIIHKEFHLSNRQMTAQLFEIEENIIVSDQTPTSNCTQGSLPLNLSKKSS